MTTDAAPPTTRADVPVKAAVLVYECISGSGTPSIRTATSTGVNLDLVAKFVRTLGNPTWSPDGKKIAYAGGESVGDDIEDPGLYVVDEDGENRTRLTNDEGALTAEPHYSPDGTKLVFTKRKGDLPGTDIFTIRLDNLAITQLTDTDSGVHHGGPQWSPDGTRIVFTRTGVGGRSHIYVVAADGSSIRQLTDGEIDDFDPVWSPDGSRLAFERRSQLGGVRRQDILVMRSSPGSDQVQFTSNDGDHHSFPAWSSDGQIISFSRTNGEDLDLWGMKANGTNPQPLLTGLGSVLGAEWK